MRLIEALISSYRLARISALLLLLIFKKDVKTERKKKRTGEENGRARASPLL